MNSLLEKEGLGGQVQMIYIDPPYRRIAVKIVDDRGIESLKVVDKYTEMIRLRKAVGHIGVGVDVLVYSETEYERRSQVPGTVLYWARKEGRPLYEATH
jgi:hypothetical protein